MTEQELVEMLDDIWTYGHEPTDKQREAVRNAMDALEELQQYRAIGTIQECREAREKQRAMRPVMAPLYRTISYYKCPICDEILDINKGFCGDCGQALDWSE